MINAPASFYQALSNSDRRFVYSAQITLKDDTVLTVGNDKIWSGGFEFEDASSPESTFQLGSAVINKFTLTLSNFEQEFSSYEFAEADVIIYVGVTVDEESQPAMVRRGTYIVNEASYEDPLITLDCYDAMYLFEKSYSKSNCNYANSPTLMTILQEACSNCGVTLKSGTTFTNQSLTVNKSPNKNDTTFREVVSWIAQIAGCFARINVNGQLEFRQYDSSALASVTSGTDGGYFDSDSPYSSGDSVNGGTFNPWNTGGIADGGTFAEMHSSNLPVNIITDVFSHKTSMKPVQFTGIRIAVKSTGESSIVNREFGTDGYMLGISDNPFITTSNVTTIGNSLWTYVQTLSFWKANVTHLANPLMEAGDVAVFWDRKGNKYPIFVTKTTFTSGEAQVTICSAQDPARASSETPTQDTKIYVASEKVASEASEARAQMSTELRTEISSVDTKVAQEKTLREAMYETLSAAINSKSGLYATAKPATGGGTIFYLHDHEDLSQSKNVWKMTSNAFAVTSNYNGTNPEQTVWSAGLTVDGTLIANILSTHGISFDWATGGAISISKNGTETFYASADSGDVRINANSVSISGVSVNSIANSAANTAISNTMTQQYVFNKLTNNGVTQGIYLNSSDNKLYINADYIKSGTISANYVRGGTFVGSGTFTSHEAGSGFGFSKLDNGKISTGYMSGTTEKTSFEIYYGIDLNTGKTFPYMQAYNADQFFIECSLTQYSTGAILHMCPPQLNTYCFEFFGGSVKMNGSLWVTGNLQVDGTYPSSSDERLKTTESWSLSDDFLSEVEPIQFRWNNGQDDKVHFGFGAQSVEKLLSKYGLDDSSIVHYDEEQDKYYLNYIEFIPLLVDKVQKLDAENKSLKSKLADMESRLAKLEEILLRRE